MKGKELLILADHIKDRPIKLTYPDNHEEIFYIDKVLDRRKEFGSDKAVVAVTPRGFEIWAYQIKKVEFVNDDHKKTTVWAQGTILFLDCDKCRKSTLHDQAPHDPELYTCYRCGELKRQKPQ